LSDRDPTNWCHLQMGNWRGAKETRSIFR
jgi:hypothetical protein